ncbi:MAG TPA: Hsp20/alpha crystallin family protein [Bacillaceae bacterium]
MFPWGLFPFNEELKKLSGKVNPADIENYISQTINKFIPPHMDHLHAQQKAETENSLEFSAKVFETFDDVFIRIPLEQEHTLGQIRIFHTSNQAIIENLLKEGDRHTVTLPAIVKRKGAKAVAKDRMLEIKIPKNIDFQYTEVDIEEKL